MKTTSLIVAGLLSLTAVASFAQTATAPVPGASGGNWARNHPRRDEVNDRLHRQDRRINQERRDGQISASQAAALHKDDHQIRQEERDMASQDHGHITRQEQRTLNQQENGVSQQIGL